MHPFQDFLCSCSPKKIHCKTFVMCTARHIDVFACLTDSPFCFNAKQIHVFPPTLNRFTFLFQWQNRFTFLFQCQTDSPFCSMPNRCTFLFQCQTDPPFFFNATFMIDVHEMLRNKQNRTHSKGLYHVQSQK